MQVKSKIHYCPWLPLDIGSALAMMCYVRASAQSETLAFDNVDGLYNQCASGQEGLWFTRLELTHVFHWNLAESISNS